MATLAPPSTAAPATARGYEGLERHVAILGVHWTDLRSGHPIDGDDDALSGSRAPHHAAGLIAQLPESGCGPSSDCST